MPNMNDSMEKDGFEVNFLVMIRNISHRMFYNKIYQNRKRRNDETKDTENDGMDSNGYGYAYVFIIYMGLKVGSYNLWLRQSIVFYGLVMAFFKRQKIGLL